MMMNLYRCMHSVLFKLCVIACSLSFFFFKQKTAYEMRISDWSSDVCSSDLPRRCGSTHGRQACVRPAPAATSSRGRNHRPSACLQIFADLVGGLADRIDRSAQFVLAHAERLRPVAKLINLAPIGSQCSREGGGQTG